MINKDTYFIINSNYDLEIIQKEKKNTILSNINSLIKIFPKKKFYIFHQTINLADQITICRKLYRIF